MSGCGQCLNEVRCGQCMSGCGQYVCRCGRCMSEVGCGQYVTCSEKTDHFLILSKGGRGL